MLKQSLYFKHDGALKKINLSEVLILEAVDNYVHYYIREQKYYLVRITLEMALKQMPPKKFVQIHRSFAVNLDFIEEIAKDVIVMKDFTHGVPMSRQYRPDVIKLIPVFKETPEKRNGQ